MAEARAGFWTDFWSFGREVFIVVLGVGLGLWAQQLVSDAGWRDTVANAKQDLRQELGQAADSAYAALQMRPCVEAFTARARRVALGQDKGPLPSRVGLMIVDPRDAAWQAAASSQALGHLSHEDLEDYAFLYSMMRELKGLAFPLREAMATVRTLDVPRPARDMGVLQTQLDAIGRLQQFHARQMEAARLLLDDLQRRQDLPVSPDGLKFGAQQRAACLAAQAPAEG